MEPGTTALPAVSNWKSEGKKATAERRASFEALATTLVVPGAGVEIDAPPRDTRGPPGDRMSLDLATLDLRPAGKFVGARPELWFRAWLDVADVRHFLDLVSVRTDRYGVQHAEAPELDAMVRLHALATGADGPFAPIRFAGRSYVLFVSPSAR